MKTKYIKIIIIFIGLILVCSSKVNAIEIKEQIKVDNLSKYEMVFLYPQGQEEEVENLKNQINEIYKECSDNLIITEKLYDESYCNKRVISNLDLQGDLEYKTIVFAFISNNMCEHIQYALQNTGASCRHIEGVSRMKVITIPTEEEAKNSLDEWKNGKENWLNYKYEENPSEAINEVYEELDTTQEEFEKAKDMNENGYGTTINVDEDNSDENVNSTETNNEFEDATIANIGNFEVISQIKEIEVKLADGTILTSELTDLDSETKVIYLDEELMHGATLFVRNEVIIKNEVDDIKDISLKYTTNKKFSNIHEDWEVNGEENTITINNVQLDNSELIETTQVITIGTEVDYQNKLLEFEYTKVVMVPNDETGEEEPTEVREKVECDIKSQNILILSEQ